MRSSHMPPRFTMLPQCQIAEPSLHIVMITIIIIIIVCRCNGRHCGFRLRVDRLANGLFFGTCVSLLVVFASPTRDEDRPPRATWFGRAMSPIGAHVASKPRPNTQAKCPGERRVWSAGSHTKHFACVPRPPNPPSLHAGSR